MKKRLSRCLLTCAIALAALGITAVIGAAMYRSVSNGHKEEAEHILHFYGENIIYQFQGRMNEAGSLARMAHAMAGEDCDWFEEEAASFTGRDEVKYVCLVNEDTVVSALPREVYGSQEGKELKEFSYIYTLAKVVKDLVVEGPVTIPEDGRREEVFLFLQPFLEENAYLGQVIVALDKEYVIDQLGFDYLSEQGYDYELWRVEPQNGGKEVVAVSRESVDFSNAAKTTFQLPTQWNLSIQPKDGWVNRGWIMIISFICLTAVLIMLGGGYILHKLILRGRILRGMGNIDTETGLYSRAGFTAEFEKWLEEADSAVTLYYFVFEGYNQISQLIDPAEEAEFLRSITERLKGFIKSPYIAGRLGEGNFAVAVRADMNRQKQENFAKGLSLEFLLKIRLNGERAFLNASYEYISCKEGQSKAGEQVALVIQKYYKRKSEESPAKMLAEKCRQLIEGKNDVVFDEYTDLDMMELSKTFNQYRKQVEQLAYSDPMFNIGNRPKYIRDANLLISYDKKRHFHLFCVDICTFSQYNQLFSTDVGDDILREVVTRLSRIFGAYLYRINGDVFLGISLTDESEERIADRLQMSLRTPVSAGSATFSLQVRVAACRYPDNGCCAEVLLHSIQSILRYAKRADRSILFYNDKLDELFKTEADIIHRLKYAIQEEELEIWYQPMVYVETGEFNVTEALVRLPDGAGGYFSAGQVVELAERSGMVEQLGDYVLEKACKFMVSHGKELGLGHMSVNLSVQQLLVGNSADHLLKVLSATGISPDLITLEITESILIQSIEHASDTLDKLRENGIHIALDDFGVGYSSLNYLSNLPVDVIKIDRSLTQQIRTNYKQHMLLKAIVEMAEINALTVVCEGVEKKEDMELISASGVQYIQGYYYARPMREEELIRFLKENA